MDDKNLLDVSVAALSLAFARSELSPVEAARAALSRVERENPRLNFMCHLDPVETLASAARAEARWRAKTPLGPLDGVPVTIKDWFAVRGWPTRGGSLLTSSEPAIDDAPPVARLREAGAVFLGKTTLPEFGHKGVTDSPLTGITRHPLDSGRTPGGSSGGAAVAAAVRAGWVHLGSDAGGSIRIPASFTGVYGFKPSPGMVAAWPPSLFATLSAAGPLARTVDDAVLMLEAIAKPDSRDALALPFAHPSFGAGECPRLKIAVARTVNDTPVEAGVAACFAEAIDVFKSAHEVEEIVLDIPDLVSVFNRHWGATAAYMASQWKPEDCRRMDPRLQEWSRRGAEMPLLDYVGAERRRLDIGLQMKALLERYDALLTPTTAMTAFAAGQDMPLRADGSRWEDWTPLTYIANLARLPAASIPCGLTPEGLPAGLQIMAGFWRDDIVLKLSRFYEKYSTLS